MKLIDLLYGALLVSLLASGAVLAKESDYSTPHCLNVLKGEREFVLPDKTRVDCLTDEVAWEYDFGPKWYEAITQAMWYSMWTARRAGVVLILDKGEDRFVLRTRRLIDHFQLPVTQVLVIYKEGP